MDLNRLLVLFYRLPPELITLGFLLMSLVLAWLFRLLRQHRPLRPALLCVTLLWAAVVVDITVLSRSPAAAQSPALIPLHSYREVLNGGNPELLRSNYMNAALFFPAGLLARSLLPDGKSPGRPLLWAMLAFACFSACIELCQCSLALGTPEIDDVIHNSLGALSGWLCFHGALTVLEHQAAFS